MDSKKRRVLKTVAAAAAAVIVVGVLCSCSPFYGKVGEMMESVASVGREKAEEIRAGRDAEYEGVTEIAEAAADSGEYDEQWERELMKSYEPFGVTYHEASGDYWFNGKPLAGIRDAGYNTMTNGIFIGIGAYVIVERDEKEGITRIYETDANGFADASGMTVGTADDLGTSMEQRAEEWGYAFHKERGSVKDMSREEFAAFEAKLHAKYRNEDAIVEVDDYAFWFEKDELMNLSSFCGSSANRYGAKVYADYAAADEMDISTLDDEKTDGIIFDVLKSNQGATAKEIEDKVKKAIADEYGISEAYLIVKVEEID